MKISVLIVIISIVYAGFVKAAPPDSTAGNSNPLVPGYFADPTIKKFGDTYYLYATTDGIKLASGEPQVWISKDFVNWYNMEMDIPMPEGLTNCWAPDVLNDKQGKFYYFMGNCEQGCNIYGYVADTPVGPWRRLNNGKPVIPAGTGLKNLPALDAQFFRDDDGTMYTYFGTWCTSFKGMGWAVIDTSDFTTIRKEGYIPISQIPMAFEGAYALKKGNRYFLMYSSGDCRLSTYAVRYAFSKSPVGPFTNGTTNPLMATNTDGSIDSPGHHSVITEGEVSYIVYHRHNNPHSSGGEFRQICADSMFFLNDSTISKISTSHKGIGYLSRSTVPYSNLAYKASANASSFYHLKSMATRFSGRTDYKYLPEFAVDDNNGTLWKASSGSLPQSLTLDLGTMKQVKRVMTQFEYPTFYYQYRIETSIDSINWVVFTDKTGNLRSGCPMIDDYSFNARYLRITVTGTEKAGMYAAIWNVKVFDHLFDVPEIMNREVSGKPGPVITNSLLVDLNGEYLNPSDVVDQLPNTGRLGGVFLKTGNPEVVFKDGAKAISFDGNSFLKLSKDAPANLGWNSAYTVAAWVLNPEVGYGECLAVWNSRENMLQSSYAALMYGTGPFGAVAHGDGYVDIPYDSVPPEGQWHHIAITFDGMIENIYVDGKLNTQLPISLFTTEGTVLIGTSGEESENFSGYLARMQLYDRFFSENEIRVLMKHTTPGFLSKKAIHTQQ